MVDCEQSLFCSKIRTRGSKNSLACAAIFASFSADFRAKERLLAVYWNGKPANHSIGSLEAQLSGIKRSRSRTVNDRFRSLCRFLVFMAIYSTIGSQTSLRRIFSSLHGSLISLRGLKKMTTWSQVYGPQLSRNEFLLAVTFRGLLNLSWGWCLQLVRERRYLRVFMMIASWNAFIAFSSLQTCDHVIILFKCAEWNQWPMKRAKNTPPP